MVAPTGCRGRQPLQNNNPTRKDILTFSEFYDILALELVTESDILVDRGAFSTANSFLFKKDRGYFSAPKHLTNNKAKNTLLNRASGSGSVLFLPIYRNNNLKNRAKACRLIIDKRYKP